MSRFDDDSTPVTEAPSQVSRRDFLATTARTGTALALGAAALETAATPALAAGDRAPISLTYWTHNYTPAENVNKQIIAAYTRSHPQVQIKYSSIDFPSFAPKLLTAFAGGNGPDVFWYGDWLVPTFTRTGILAPFDPSAYGVASQQAFVNRFDPHTFDAFTAAGKLYAAGISEVDTYSLFYNKSLFREMGIPYPSATEPMTWAQTAAIAQKLTKFSNGQRVRSGLEFQYGADFNTMINIEPIVRQLGGELVQPGTGTPQFDSAPVVRTMQFFHDLRFKYKATDPAFITSSTNTDFANGRIAMAVVNLPAIPFMYQANPKMQGNIGIAPQPIWQRGGRRVTAKYAWAWLVNAHSTPEKQREAFRFIASLQAHKHQWYDACGFIQPMPENDTYMQSKNPLFPVYNDDLKHGLYSFRSAHAEELIGVLLRAFDRVLNGDNPSTVMTGAQREALRAVR